jgi:NADPH:quinone reductase
MVKAIRVHEYGGPDVMRLEEITLPPPGPGEVRVAIHAAGVNYIDTYFRTGAYKAPALPFIPGNEAAGVIEAVGSGVTGFGEGDRVVFESAFGGYATARLVPVGRLVKLPEAISFTTAAAMMLKGLTAQYLLRQTYVVQPGDTILVHAAAGGVGLILCQWAKKLGATVVGTVGSEAKAEQARKAGADHVILYRDEDFVSRVREITDGRLCPVVYDGVGKATFSASLDCLRPRGLLVSFGSASGKVDAFDLGLLAPKGSLYVTRPTLATYAHETGAMRAMAAELMDLVGTGAVAISIHDTAPLEAAAAVHRSLEGRETTGSTVLVM